MDCIGNWTVLRRTLLSGISLIAADRSLSRTGPGKIENLHDVIEIDIASGPAVAGTRFLAVAEVYSLAVEIEGDPLTDSMNDSRSATPEEDVRSHPLEHSGAEQGVGPFDGPSTVHPLEHLGAKPGFSSLGKVLETEPLEHSVLRAPREKVTNSPLLVREYIRKNSEIKEEQSMTITVVRSKKSGRRMHKPSRKKDKRLLWELLGQRHPGS